MLPPSAGVGDGEEESSGDTGLDRNATAPPRIALLRAARAPDTTTTGIFARDSSAHCARRNCQPSTARHQHVEDDEAGSQARVETLQGFASVGSFHRPMPIGPQNLGDHLARIGIVLDDKNR